MDTFFLSHGSPTLSIDDSLPARHFLQSWRSKVLPAVPRAILVVSGHWETASPTVNVINGSNDTIHDFYGFPQRMYKLKYPAPGAPDLAKRVKELLQNGGFGLVKEDNSRGLDHGAWVPLMLMYPNADIPVCQLSIQTEMDATYHYNMGKALAPLKDEGVLIVGSGSATHNLRNMSRGDAPVAKWALEFDTWLKEALLGGRYDEVNNYMEKAPNARMAHPWPDHFHPLHVALGAAGERAKAELIHHSWTNSTISYASYSKMEMEVAEEDDRIRTGTVWTATAHIITAVIGSGILTLPWSVAQLGWILGPLMLFFFAFITYLTAILLADCYRFPDPTNGRRNKTYMDVVRASLGKKDILICGIIQYSLLWGTMVGYTITSAMSMMAIDKAICVRKKGPKASCEIFGTLHIIIFGIIEAFLSQFPSLEKVTVLSYIAAAMSFAYSLIGLCLCLLEFFSHPHFKGTLLGSQMGASNVSSAPKLWSSFQALGNIAFAYSFSMVLIEIQDTLKSPPTENRTMKKSSIFGIGFTTLFYVSLGCVGYAAFGNDAPGNILTGFQEPIWLIEIAHLAVIIHLVGAYQIFAQPIFAFYEEWFARKWPDAGFFQKVYTLKAPFSKSRSAEFTLCKLIMRPLLVIVTTAVAAMLPFFNAMVGLLGALGFWPLTVYYPVSMYINQAKIKRMQMKWVVLQSMTIVSLVVSLVATIGSVADILEHLKHAELFKMKL